MIKKSIPTGKITYIQPVPGATADWYYGLSAPQGDLYEAEELFHMGFPVKGNELCLVRYPDGEVFRPLPQKEGTYIEAPVYLEGSIALLSVDFPAGLIRIHRFDCESRETSLLQELPLAAVTNCYNLMLHTAPLCLTRQGDDDFFEILWPKQVRFPMEPQESFFLRQGDRLYFSKWHEEGEGADYAYWEETVVRDLAGRLLETIPGDVMIMPNGELWQLGDDNTNTNQNR